MSETLKAGLYKATVRRVADVTVFVDGAGYGRTADYVLEWREHNPHDITDLRPLIVLDLDSAAREYVGDLRYVADRLPAYNVHRALVHELADQIEAQTRPARIEEPSLGGEVEAHTRHDSFRAKWLNGFDGWRTLSGRERALWRDLSDPTLIREGVN